MIIDTNGFEIGDEVWVCWKSIGIDDAIICSFKIKGFKYYNGTLILINEYGIECALKSTYHTKQECQLACDKLNGKIENENSKSFFHFQKVFE